jgi:hypothetical protein
MAQPIASRRAAAYRQCAQQLTETAAHERRDDERRRLLDLAAMYQRIADEMAPAAGGDNTIPPEQSHDERTNSLRHYRNRKSG